LPKYHVVRAKNIEELILRLNNEFRDYELKWIKEEGIISKKVVAIVIEKVS